MTLDEYVTRYRLLQRAVEQDERVLFLMDQAPYSSFIRRFGDGSSRDLAPHVLSHTLLENRLRRRERLCLRYAERLARAVALIRSPVLQQYALCRYLYGMTQESIAQNHFFSLRTTYRHARSAARAMTEAMKQVEPKVRRTPPGRYTCAVRLPRRDYAVTRENRAAARRRGIYGLESKGA